MGWGGHGGCVSGVFWLSCVVSCYAVLCCVVRDRWFLVNAFVQFRFEMFQYQRGENIKINHWENCILSLVDTITKNLNRPQNVIRKLALWPSKKKCYGRSKN